jgi:hypothetical protein
MGMADHMAQPSFTVDAEWLTGSWSLERNISDGSLGTGTARIAPFGRDRLSFHEVVALTLASGQTIAGSRSFTVEADAEAMVWRFADGPNHGALFQRFCGAANGSTSSHSCGDDLYRSTLTLLGPDCFEMVHEVSGPEKSYVMTTRYFRTAQKS